MNESLERQDSAALFLLLNRPDRALPQLREHRERFDAAAKRAAANVTEPGEAAIVEQIAADRDEYYRRFDGFVAALAGSADARLPSSPSAVYFSQLEPVFADIRRQCDRLLTVNQDAMRRKASEAAALARRWFLMTLGAALALVVAGAWFASALSASILRPVTQLTEATNRLAAGDLDAVVAIRRGDELSVLGDRFNEMAGRLRQHRQSDLGKVLVAQQTAEAAVDSLYDPLIVTDAGGRIQRVNRAAESVFGPEAAILGMALQDVSRDPRLSMAVVEALNSQRAVASEASGVRAAVG
jgi:NtrC-family two-component system sensor histidine kinase KinB